MQGLHEGSLCGGYGTASGAVSVQAEQQLKRRADGIREVRSLLLYSGVLSSVCAVKLLR